MEIMESLGKLLRGRENNEGVGKIMGGLVKNPHWDNVIGKIMTWSWKNGRFMEIIATPWSKSSDEIM